MAATTKAVLAAFVLSAISLTAYGAEQKADKGSAGGKSATTFQKADADGNGAISMDEARSVSGLADNFAKADKNGDGQLSKSEYESAVKSKGKTSKSDQGAGSSGAKSTTGAGSKGAGSY